MNRLVKKMMVVLLSVFMFMGAVTTPVQAKDTSNDTNWNWHWWWTQPAPEPTPTEEPVVDETPVETEEPVVEEPVVEEEEPVVEETPVVAEEPAEETAYPAMTLTPVEALEGTDVTAVIPEGALPEGTTMTVAEVNLSAVQDAVDKAEDISGTVVAAVDITFYNAAGEVVEPKLPISVTMTSEEIAKVEDPQVVHVDTTAEEIEEADVAAEAVEAKAEADTVEFDAEHFSVYAIIEGTEPGQATPYRATYEFYNADGSIYYFKDAAGRDQHTQILKNEEILEDVGIPTAGASQNAKFVGWFDENGNEVKVGEPKTVTKNETIKLTAKLQAIVNVFFVTAVMKDDQGQDMSRSIVTVKQVEYTVGQTDPITVDTSDVTTDAPTSEQAVVGWNRTEAAANAGTVEGSNGIITLYENGTGTITDVMLFPAIQDAYWLYFNENDGGTGGGASYTQPQFVTIGSKPTRPADPHRTGYSFGGWYKDTACTQPFSFDEVLQATTTVYAKWDGSNTTYSVVVWVQSTSDSAYLPSNGQNRPEAERQYDFYHAYSISSITGGTATVANTYKNLGTTLDRDGHIYFDRCDADKVVAANGSTVMNVYYDRDVMTIRWYNRNGNVTDTWYGLYNATFKEANKVWKSGSWESDQYPISVMDAFVDFDTRTDTVLNLYPASSSGSYHLYFYKENLNGAFERVYDSPLGQNTRVTLAEKYKPGFDLDTYVRNSTTSYPGDNANWNEAVQGNTVNSNGSNVHVRYTRNSFDIEYHNGALNTEGTVVKTDSIKFEASLTNHQNPSVTYPIAADADHYQFIGWFADSSWTTLVTFTELSDTEKETYTNYYGVSNFVVINKMPAHNLALYAGYALKGWDCALNPNGGEFTNPDQAGLFWLDYGNRISSDIKSNIKREGYTFQGWMVANVPLNAEGNLDILAYTTDSNNHRFVTNYSNWTITDTPWEFSTGITGPTALMAKWFYKTAMSVVYDADEGSDAPIDRGVYSDHAQTVAFRAPVAPKNKVFIGWDIVGTDTVEKLQPGAQFEVSSDYATDGVVTLKALYNSFGSEEEVPVSHIDWYANNTKTAVYVTGTTEDGQDITQTQLLHVSDAPIQLNAGVDIRPESTFTNSGYKFLGWAKLHDDDGTLKDHKDSAVVAATEGNMDYALTEANLYLKYENGKFFVEADGKWVETAQVAADENLPYDDLYAVWKEEFFYVYHSSDKSVDKISMVGHETFDITNTVKNGFMYGGYYNDYAKKGSYKGDGVAVTDGTAYIGGLGYWSKKNAITANGRTMKPEANKTYYLKEVPNAFLSNLVYIIYDAHNENTIVHNYLICNVDDNNYNDVALIAKDIYTGERIKLASSFTINDTFNNKTDKITAKDKKYFDTKAGYVAVWKPNLATQDYEFAASYTTPDGVKVEGSFIKQVVIGDGKYYNTFESGDGMKLGSRKNENLLKDHAGNLSSR